MRKNVKNVGLVGTPWPNNADQRAIRAETEQREEDLSSGLTQEDEADVRRHTLTDDDQRKPRAIRAELQEEKLPPQAEVTIGPMPRRDVDDPCEERTKTSTPHGHRHHPDDQHCAPVTLVAQHASVHHQRPLPAWIGHALRYSQRHLHNRTVEQEDDAQATVHDYRGFHRNFPLLATQQPLKGHRCRPCSNEDCSNSKRCKALKDQSRHEAAETTTRQTESDRHVGSERPYR